MSKAKRSSAARGGLAEYEAKRNFDLTPEPAPKGRHKPRAGGATFMVHKHDATRLHYDLRLEIDGALASWAVPKGPSFDPEVKRLAVQTEDHPLEYGGFEGRIPDDEYGGGDSLIWDRGTFTPVPPLTAEEQRKKGHLTFELAGDKLKGRWHLVRTHGNRAAKNGWLLFKAHDEFADPKFDVVTERPESVVSGRKVTRGPERLKTRRAPHPAPERLLQSVFPPMLATLVTEVPEHPAGWVYEVKYDGYRAVSAISGGKVAVWTRNSLDLTARFPHLKKALEKIVVGEAVIDGEIVILDEKGVSRFELLQQGHFSRGVLFAFDLLWLDGEDLRGRPLEERRDLLVSLLSNAPPELIVAERLPAEGALAAADKRGLEGIIAKRLGSPYEGTRSGAWLKVKTQKAQELAIVGFTPSERRPGEIGALLLGVARGGELHFAGKVGTGFTTKQRAELLKTLSKEVVDAPEVQSPPRMRDARWVKPRLVGQVRFTEWTSDGKLRHPLFQGLRPDKTPLECVLEKPRSPARASKAATMKPTATKATASKATASRAAASRMSANLRSGTVSRRAKPAPGLIKLTHPDKLIYPRDGITKQDIADYYEAVSGPLLAALDSRPLALEHVWEGIDGPSLFKQNLGKARPAWATVIETPTRTKKGSACHLIADRPEALRWIAQQSALTIHMWLSRAPALEEPSFALIDLDPADGEGIEQAIGVALVLRHLFEELEIPSIPKTSGKRGLHVLIPLQPGHSFEEVVNFTVQIGEALAQKLPEITLERSKDQRRGRLYFDCYQNAYGKTMVAPYSLRSIDGAPVSAPLEWGEIHKGLDPSRFNLRTMPERLAKKGDLFAPALARGIRLPKLR